MAIFTAIASALAPSIIEAVVKGVKKLETGGAVNKTQMAMVHKGEFMLPKGVRPTPAQRRAVAKKKVTKAKARVKAPRGKAVVVRKKRKGKK